MDRYDYKMRRDYTAVVNKAARADPHFPSISIDVCDVWAVFDHMTGDDMAICNDPVDAAIIVQALNAEDQFLRGEADSARHRREAAAEEVDAAKGDGAPVVVLPPG